VNSVFGISSVGVIDKGVALFHVELSDFTELSENLIQIAFTNTAGQTANVNSVCSI
jgi:hypothetical protein